MQTGGEPRVNSPEQLSRSGQATCPITRPVIFGGALCRVGTLVSGKRPGGIPGASLWMAGGREVFFVQRNWQRPRPPAVLIPLSSTARTQPPVRLVDHPGNTP